MKIKKKGFEKIVSYFLGTTITSLAFIVTAIHELTGRYATATGSQTSAYFNNLGYLEQEFAPDYGRTLYINLMDEDFTGGDDLIKEYQGTFEGRRLATIKRTSVKINGAFEANGDATAELYLNARMTPHYDDDLNFKTRLFRYKLVN